MSDVAADRLAKTMRLLDMHKGGFSTRAIAASFGVTERHVLQILDACRLVGLEAPATEEVAA